MKTNRWLPVVGGILMNLALGSLYAWSVFVAAARKGVRLDAHRDLVGLHDRGRVLCGDVHCRRPAAGSQRPEDLRVPWRHPGERSGSFSRASRPRSSRLYIFFGVIVGVGNGFGYSTPTPVASKWFPDKRGLVVGLMVGGYGAGQAIFGTLANERLIPALGWRTTFQILSGIFLVMTMIGATLLKNPPAGYRPANWTPSRRATRRTRDFTTGRDAAHADVLSVVDRLCVRHDGRTDDDQSAGAVCADRGSRRHRGHVFVDRHLARQCRRPHSLRLDVRHARPAAHAADDGVPVGAGDAGAVPAAQRGRAVLRADRFSSTGATAPSCRCLPRPPRISTGRRNLGLNYGVLFTAWGAAGILGPGVAGRIFDRFGDYRYAFYSAAAFAVIAFVALLSAKPPSLQRATGEVSLKNDLIPAAPRA